jgi:adenine-specific DNA-methyltransferase
MAETNRKNKLKTPENPVRKMDGHSHSPQQELLALLEARCPEVFTEGKIDGGKLKQTLGEELDTNNERYGLTWAGKSECFHHIQETTTATLKPIPAESVDFDATENIFIEGDNLEVLKILQKTYQNKIKMIYIDPPYNTGNDSFIYPDRFKEEKEDYEQRAGIKDAEGLLTKDGFWRKNSKDAGHFHSTWLSMMYPRLFLAKNLLREDGVIFISIDDNEVHNLRMIMNEIFGEENFLACIAWEKRYTRSNNAKLFYSLKDSILVYRRSEAVDFLREKRTEKSDSIYKNPDNDPRGPWTSSSYVNPATRAERPNLVYPIKNPFTDEKIEHPTHAWKYEPKEHARHVKENLLWWGLNGEVKYPRLKNFLSDAEKSGLVPIDIWYHKATGTTDDGGTELKSLFGGTEIFDNPKPYQLTARMVALVSNGEDKAIVLDFFAGSCTTAHAVMALNAEDGGNRKFICVQLAEPCEEESEAYKVGFKTIADIGKERIRRAAKKIEKEIEGNLKFDKNRLDLGFKVFRLDQSNFKQWRENVKTGDELKEQMRMFVDNVKKGAASEDMLFEIILKNSRFNLNVKVEKQSFDGVDYYRLATEDPSTTLRAGSEGTENVANPSTKLRAGKTKANSGNEIVCLAPRITKKFIDKVLSEKPEKFTCLDVAFKNNDQLKTNTALQMEAAKIEFKVI